MKTIKQIADEIGVSKQAIQKRISREPLYTRIQPYISTKQGTKYIEDIGENLIKSAFSINLSIDTSIDVADNRKPDLYIGVHSKEDVTIKEPSKENSHFDGEIIKLLQENIVILQKQLEIKDKQIEELTLTVRTQAESINADRKNELAGTLLEGHKLIGGPPPEQTEETDKKKGFFQKFFKK